MPKGLKVRRLHKAFLRYHDPNNWPLLREALRRMGRADLIGSGRQQLVPAYQPAGTGEQSEGRPRARRASDLPHPTHRAAAHKIVDDWTARGVGSEEARPQEGPSSPRGTRRK